MSITLKESNSHMGNRVAIVGTYGVPVSHGGFETFADRVSLEWGLNDVEVLIVGDASCNSKKGYHRNVNVMSVPFYKNRTPLLYYLFSLKCAVNLGYKVVVITGVGGAVFVPLLRVFGIKCYLNPDGLGFQRDKYSAFKKGAFFALYWLAAKLSDRLVYDSPGIKAYFEDKLGCKKSSRVIEYGAAFPQDESLSLDLVNEQLSLQLKKNEFHLVVARLEPENNVALILKGYSSSTRFFPLVVVGPTNTLYAQQLPRSNTQVFYVGGVYDELLLSSLRLNCRSYWHGHSVGGTNPSLLEAMAHSGVCCVHDNIFNKHVVGESGFYFSNHEHVDDLFCQLEERMSDAELETKAREAREVVESRFTWKIIASKYYQFMMNEQA